MLHNLVLGILVFFCLAGSADAMEYRLIAPSVLLMKGNIDAFEDSNLQLFLRLNLGKISNQSLQLQLDSWGGNNGGALELAKFAADKQVVVTGVCASACFTIFASARERWVGRTARIGVHSPVANAYAIGDRNAATAIGTISQVRIWAGLHVPSDVIVDMLMTSNQNMHWLTADQLVRMGAQFLP